MCERDLPPDLGCDLPPEGWWCSRPPDHEGPCAARRVPRMPSGTIELHGRVRRKEIRRLKRDLRRLYRGGAAALTVLVEEEHTDG